MKTDFDWIRHLSFHSLRFRLMVYLLISGSVPLVLALVLFYQQSARFAQSEYEAHIAQNHERIVQTLQKNISKIEEEALNLNKDRQIQLIMMAESDAVGMMNGEFGDELNRHIADITSGELPVSGVCFSFHDSGLSVCNDTSIIETTPPTSRTDARIETLSAEDSESGYLRYVAPMYTALTGEIKGYTVFLIDRYRLVGPGNESAPILEHVIVNGKGVPIVHISDVPIQGQIPESEIGQPFVRVTSGGVFSGQPVTVLSNKWMSIIRWEIHSYDELRSALGRTAIVLVILLAMVSAAISFLFGRSVTRPIQALRQLMKRAELGDLKAYWTLRTTRDIDELGESYNQMLNRLEDVIKQVKVEESLKKEKEFEALQYQLNPHFLYNTLNTIKWVAKIHKTPQISEAVSALVRLLQSSLGKRGDFLPLHEELGLVHDYLEIQKFRYGEEIALVSDIEPVARICLVPKLILQPLVENAIIHGLDHKIAKDKQITIKAWLDRDLLYCQVEDNGKGMDPELLLSEHNGKREGAKEKMSGIGLRHIREKIKLYYGPDYKMLIFSKPNQGTTIRLSLPIHRSDES